MRKNFVFYSFLRRNSGITGKKIKISFLPRIAEQALSGKEPELQGVENMLFILVEPRPDADCERYENSP